MDLQPSTAGRARRAWMLAVVVPAILAVPFLVVAQSSKPAATRPDRSPNDLRREYQERFDRLGAADLKGHLELAEWCRTQELYRLLLRQSQYILRLDPGNAEGSQLYRLAGEKLRAQNQNTPSRPADGQPRGPENTDREFLTPAQIQKLKFAEFLDLSGGRPRQGETTRARGSTSEEFLQVRYQGRVLEDFLADMSGQQDFETRDQRNLFLELPPTRQLQILRQKSGTKYQNRIEIVNDPLVFRQFDKVLPLVLAGCGTTACHGGDKAEGWRLRTGRPATRANLYSNYLVLIRAHKGNQMVVNRAKPEDSLLLHFALPSGEAEFKHPEDIPPLFPQGRNDSRYRTFLTWIQTLQVPEPRTGVALPGYPEPPLPQIGGPAPDKAVAPAEGIKAP